MCGALDPAGSDHRGRVSGSGFPAKGHDDAVVKRTRLCHYPRMPEYNGHGNVDDAA
jgi:hypothetical protein